MHTYFIYGFVLCLSIWHNDHTVVETFAIEDLENELSTSTYLAISNYSYVKSKVTLEDHLKFKRELESTSFGMEKTRRSAKSRWDLRDFQPEPWKYWTGVYYHNTSYHGTIMRMCFLISTTAKAAIFDLEYYYPKRYFYRNLRDFEIGYLTHEIVHTYNSILELYHTMIYQYDMQNFTYFAPPGYMFFIYTNMVLLGKHLIHQCNMIAELENKFKGAIALFNDTTTTVRPDDADIFKIHQTRESVDIIRNITREKQKERQRERKRQLDVLHHYVDIHGINATQTKHFKEQVVDRLLKMKRQRKPYKSKWPVSYGWSVEETFKGYSYWSGIHNYSADIDSSKEEEMQRKYEEMRANRTKEHCNDDKNNPFQEDKKK